MKSPSQHSFAEVPRAEIQRSVFKRNAGYKTTFDGGYLIPVFCEEALPGDTMNVKMATFARLATPLHPIMDNMHLDAHFFAVPIRLIWDNWQKFNGEQEDPGDSTDFLVPETEPPGGGYLAHTVSDYMGLPTLITGLKHSVLWHRAYNLIYREWFRDENIQDSPTLKRDDGPDLASNFPLRRRGKRHDYLTSCLPFPQKGPSVQLPLGSTAPVSITSDPLGDIPTFKFDSGGESDVRMRGDSGNDNVEWSAGISGNQQAQWDDPGLVGVTDLTNATAATINEIRQAFQIQRLYERDARGGTRYTEVIRSHFGVTSPDQRLQRPEFLGGGSTPVSITPVPQTSNANPTNPDVTPQGNLAAFGVASATGQGFLKSFTEHCVILGLISVRADLTYQQCLPRMFSRRTRWDFYWPALAHLGEQAVLRKEIYATGVEDDDNIVFGYQERYAEYRYKQSLITGQFRSNHATSLDTWHLAQDFDATPPVLNDLFITENPPIDRIIAVTSEPHFLFDAYFQIMHARPMPTYGVPGLIDHF